MYTCLYMKLLTTLASWHDSLAESLNRKAKPKINCFEIECTVVYLHYNHAHASFHTRYGNTFKHNRFPLNNLHQLYSTWIWQKPKHRQDHRNSFLSRPNPCSDGLFQSPNTGEFWRRFSLIASTNVRCHYCAVGYWHCNLD